MTTSSTDILVLNGTVLTMDSTDTRINNGAIAIRGDKILALGPAENFSTWRATVAIDACNGVIMPGLVNTHTHLPMTLFRGLADDLPLDTWLNNHIFPAEKEYLNPETARYGALLACAEMLLSGTTTCCDGYFFENEVAEAVRVAGIRAILGQGVIDFPAPDVPDPSQNINNALAFTGKWKDACPVIAPSIFCHSPYTCSKDTLIKAKESASSQGLLFQIHAAETRNEWDQIKSEHRMTPIGYLDSLGLLDQETLLVHAIWVDDDDIDIIAKRRAKVSVTTESEMKLASGIAPIPKFLKANIIVGLGTDGSASNNDLDLFQEMDTTAKLHKVNTGDPTVMDAMTVLKASTIEGAKAIGLDREIGSLEIGKQADLIVIDTRKPRLIPLYNAVSHIVYAVNGSDIRDVIVAGKILVRDKKLLTLDLEEILDKVASIGKTIRETASFNF